MTQYINAHDLDLGEIRRRAWRAWAQDGLLEIALASWLVYFFITSLGSTLADPNMDWLQVTMIFPMSMIVGMPYLKKRFTYPRVGAVTMVSEEALKLLTVFLTFTAVLGVVVFFPVFDGPGHVAARHDLRESRFDPGGIGRRHPVLHGLPLRHHALLCLWAAVHRSRLSGPVGEHGIDSPYR